MADSRSMQSEAGGDTLARQIIESEISVIVYDDTQVSHIKPAMFDAIYWRDKASSAGQQGGRGSILFVTHEGSEWAIRHFYRGGLIGRLLTDQYLWSGQEQTRSFQEWHLLKRLQQEGLPAPVPVAARYQRQGLFYTADLITHKLPGVESLAGRYLAGQLDVPEWRSTGECIAAFHSKGFCHADLNAWNIQLGSDGRVWILDWDRGRRLHPGNWRQTNLQRLRRSLDKIAAEHNAPLSEHAWEALLEGYRSAT